MQNLFSLFSPRYPTVLAYMLQSTKYQPWAYLRLLHATKNFAAVMHKHKLKTTRPALISLWVLRIGMLAEIIAGLSFVYLGLTNAVAGGVYFGLAIIIVYPLLWAYLAAIPLLAGKHSRVSLNSSGSPKNEA